jgi:hypothetical protein
MRNPRHSQATQGLDQLGPVHPSRARPVDEELRRKLIDYGTRSAKSLRGRQARSQAGTKRKPSLAPINLPPPVD